MELMAQQQIPVQRQSAVQQLAEASRPLGPQLHVQTDYGDEFIGRSPWELFGEEEAREVAALAAALIRQVEELVQEVSREQFG